MSTFQICTLANYLDYTYISFLLFFINAFFIVMSGSEIIRFDEEIDVDSDTKASILKTIQLYSIGQIILITSINIIMIILGNNILYGIINVGTYYIVVYILYRISKNVITNSKTQTY